MSLVSNSLKAHWLKALTLGAALAVTPLAGCAEEASDVSETAGALKGGVPNSANGKGRANAMNQGKNAQAGATAPTSDDAGVESPKMRGQGKGQAAAAGAPAQQGKSVDKGNGKAKSTDAKTNKGMGMGGMDMGMKQQDGAEDTDDGNDETDESADEETPTTP